MWNFLDKKGTVGINIAQLRAEFDLKMFKKQPDKTNANIF